MALLKRGSCGDELSGNCPSSLLSQHLTLLPCAPKQEVTRLPGCCWLSDLSQRGSDEIIWLVLAE